LNKTARAITIALSIVFALTISDAAAKKQTFQQLSDEILEAIQTFYPVHATQMGVHAYDHRFADYSSKSVKQMVNRLNDFEKKLYKYRGASLNDHDRLNYKLLKSNVDIALLDLKRIKWHQKSPQLYVDEAVNGVYSLLLSNHAPLSERVVSIINRMKGVPALFATARKNLRNPPPIYIESAAMSLESGITFYKEVAAELMKNFPERADNISKVSTAAREAMNDFLVHLSEITPGKETSFAIGKNNFDYLLSNQYFLDCDSDSMLVIGEALLDEVSRAYREYETYVEDHHQNGNDSVYVPAQFSRQDILDYYNWETNQVKFFLENHDLITIPEDITPVTVIETPSFLRSLHSGIAYQPAGPFDSVQQALFYVRPIPENLDRVQLEMRYRYVHRRGFKGSVVHEAYPGHHLQFQIAGRNPDPVRKWQSNPMMYEGWALYCEEMIYDAGLYGQENPSRWLRIIKGIRFRAARIVADIKLHTGQFTYNECVRWMIDVLGIDTDSDRKFVETEVRRYTLEPTVQMSYLMGKRELMNLRQAAMDKQGDAFSLKDFHDALLAEGSVPPTLMWDVLGLKNQ